MSARLQQVMPKWPPYGEAVTALSDLASTALGVLHESPLTPSSLAALEPNTLGAAGAVILQHQDSCTYSVCLSRLPDSGMILIGLA